MATIICLRCGDKGSSNDLVYCVNCLEVAVHRNAVVFPPRTDLVEYRHAAQPVDEPIWRGCFNIWNKRYELAGVVAHLSDKASRRVAEKSKLLMLYLHFEMVSKVDLWPKYFNTSEATDSDIELFFFPSEARHQENFDRLVEDMIGGLYSLRALTPYGELLVFTSTELPLPHWRYKLKCYLWGIFRPTQGSSRRLVVPNRIQSEMVRQNTDNDLGARDVVNDRAPTEVDGQDKTDELGRGKRIKRRTAKLDDYV